MRHLQTHAFLPLLLPHLFLRACQRFLRFRHFRPCLVEFAFELVSHPFERLPLSRQLLLLGGNGCGAAALRGFGHGELRFHALGGELRLRGRGFRGLALRHLSLVVVLQS